MGGREGRGRPRGRGGAAREGRPCGRQAGRCSEDSAVLFAYTSVEPTLPTMVEQPTATNHQTHHLGVRGAIAPDSRLKEEGARWPCPTARCPALQRDA